MRRGIFNVWKTGRKDRKGSMSHEAEEKLQNARRMSFVECLTSVTGMEMSMRSHLVVNVKFGGDMPRVELVHCDCEVEICLLVDGASGSSLSTAEATVTGRGGRGCGWKNDRIVFVEFLVD